MSHRLYIPIQPVVDEVRGLLANKEGPKSVIVSGSPGMGKSMLANDLACKCLPGSDAIRAAQRPDSAAECLSVSPHISTCKHTNQTNVLSRPCERTCQAAKRGFI